MEEIAEGTIKVIARILVSIFKAIFFTLFELFPEYVLWPIGWCVWRTITLGKYPAEGIFEQDEARIRTQLIVGITGLAFPVVVIYCLYKIYG